MADSRDKVHERAYHLWRESGGEHGRDMEHWLRAEREMSGESGTKTTAAGKPASARIPKAAAEAKKPVAAKKAAAKSSATGGARKAAPAAKPKTST